MRILLDTGAMAGTAATLRQIDGELDALSLRVAADAAVLMPPAVAAQVAGEVGAAAAGMRRISARYAGLAGDLDRRRAFAEASEGIGRGPSLWQRLVAFADSRLVEAADGVHGMIDVIAATSARLRLTTLNKLDAIFIKARYSRGYKLAGRVLLPLAIISAADEAWDEWNDPRNGNWLGRSIAMRGSIATDAVLYLFPPAGLLDFVTDGAIEGELDGIFGIAARGTSDAWDAGFAAGRRELENGNYLGLGWHVGTAALGGFARGANTELNHWNDDVLAGEHGGFLKTFAEVENKVIDKAWSAGETAVGAVSSAGRSVRKFVGDLF
jgi:hypothetical protein